ncbi:MAG: phenylacetate--CoA ligase [Desulfarculales bacterium]|jgi:phenylacetate-CoA ligase|nr:phenylacetate--CoA ligase [Desulfarculales bacterium]
MWNKEVETAQLEQMQSWQLARLRENLHRVYENVPFYKKKFDHIGFKPGDFKKLSDLNGLPFTLKNDLRDNYPFGLSALPMSEITRIQASSGTTGRPIIGTYTSSDVSNWGECCARALTASGIGKNDIIQVSYGYGLFTGGLGLHGGGETVGCTVLPTSSGITERQVTMMRDLGVDSLCCTPSYALTIADKANEMGIDIAPLKIRTGCFGAEPWSDEMRREIETRMGITAHNIYGLTEMMGPGMSFTCNSHDGWLHVNEDHIYPEIIDPVTEETLPYGEIGELVFTALSRQAMPLIRYRTRDISALDRKPCPHCRRTLIKMKKIMGRTDDMLIISGVNVFPSQIESLLLDTPEVEPQYVIVVRKKGHLDALSVDVEAKAHIYEQGQDIIREIAKKVEKHIHGVIGIHVAVRLVAPRSIQRSEGKAKRVFDTRNT